MAKKENLNDIEGQIKAKKKKTTLLIIIIAAVCLGAGGFVGFSMFQKNALAKVAEAEALALIPLKDRVVEGDKTMYTRDVAKQTYMLSNGLIQFEGSIVFYNKLCANLYTGVNEAKALESTTPDLTVADTLLGDKIMRNAVTKYLQSSTKGELSSAVNLSTGLVEAINTEFEKTLGNAVVKDILITSHIVQ